jgi:8-oxo-dGTP diphosphatase
MNQNYLPQVAVGAVIFKENKVLLVKRGQAPAKGKWAVPGGKINAGEIMAEALKREIREETNLEIEVGDVVLVFDVLEHDEKGQLLFHYVIIDFECSYVRGELRPGDDAVEARWISENELVRLDVNIKTLNLLKEKYLFGVK